MDTVRQRLRPTRPSRLNDNELSFVKRTVKQTIVCCIIIAISYATTLINTPATKNIAVSAHNTLDYTVDFNTATQQIIDVAKNIPLPWNTPAKETVENVQAN